MVCEGDIVISETGEGNATITSSHPLPRLGTCGHRSSVEHVASKPILSNTIPCAGLHLPSWQDQAAGLNAQ